MSSKYVTRSNIVFGVLAIVILALTLAGCGAVTSILGGSTTASIRAGDELTPKYVEWSSSPGLLGVFIGGKTESGCSGDCPRTTTVPTTSTAVVAPAPYGHGSAPYYLRGGSDAELCYRGRATLPPGCYYFPSGNPGTGVYPRSPERSPPPVP